MQNVKKKITLFYNLLFPSQVKQQFGCSEFCSILNNMSLWCVIIITFPTVLNTRTLEAALSWDFLLKNSPYWNRKKKHVARRPCIIDGLSPSSEISPYTERDRVGIGSLEIFPRNPFIDCDPEPFALVCAVVINST